MRESHSAAKSSALHPESASHKLTNLLLNLACLAGVAFIVTYLAVALLRLRYPYELEWMEGGAVDHVLRILHGQLLYVKPSLEFIPYIYTPLYYYLSALVSLVTGVGFFPLRLVSLLACLGTLALIFTWIRNESGGWRLGLVAAGLFAATYHSCGDWFDIARGDSLFIFLLIFGAFWLRFARTPRTLLLAAVLIWLAFLAKQTTLFIAVPLIVYSVFVDRRKSLYFTGPFVALTALSVWILDLIHDGWFSYYIFRLPAHHKIDPEFYLGFWRTDILVQVPVILLLAVALIVLAWFKRDRKLTAFYFFLCAGGVAASWSSRLHTGGYNNVLMPAFLVLCLTSGALLTTILGKSFREQSSSWRNWRILVLAAVIFQFGLLAYNPSEQVPTQWENDAGAEVLKALAAVPGDLYMPYHGYFPSEIGKHMYAHQMAIKDVARGDSAMARELTREMTDAFTSRRFGLVVIDYPWESASLQRNYEVYSGMPQAVLSFQPVTGYQTRPLFWYVPRKDTVK